MTGLCLPIDAVAGAPSFPAAQHRAAQAAMLLGRTDRPLGAVSGVRPGAEPTVTVTATQYTVTPFTAVVDPVTSLSVGPYLCAFLANEVGGINAAHATLTRIDRLDVQVPDDPAGASALAAVIVYTAGVAASSPSAPAAPARSFPLGLITVPAAGAGSPSFSASTLTRTVASGGVLPVNGVGQYPAHPYRGQYIDDAALGLLRWNGSTWTSVAATKVAWTYDRPTTFSVPNGVTTKVPLTSLVVDRTGAGVAGNQFNVTAAGPYLLSGSVSFAGSTAGRRSVTIAVNGSVIEASVLVPTVSTGSGVTQLGTAALVWPLAVGDVVDLRVYQDSGAALNTTAAALSVVQL